MSSLQSLDIAARSASSTSQIPHIRQRPVVAKLIDVSSCIGCKACQVACMEWNDLRDQVGETQGTYDNPRDLTPHSWTVMRYAEVVMPVAGEGTRLEWLIRKDGCMHCEEPGCLKACPAPGAIVKYQNGIVDFIDENCIGCGNCVIGCPFNIPRLSKSDNKAYKCSLCSDRVAVGLEPACVKTCPTGAIRFGSKENMHEFAAGRVADLRERGYDNAGVYDPQGVRGTHVMYVLQHADQPTLYQGLPENPTISPLVRVWKEAARPVGALAVLAAVVAAFLHYFKVGPLETPEEEASDGQKDAPGNDPGNGPGNAPENPPDAAARQPEHPPEPRP